MELNTDYKLYKIISATYKLSKLKQREKMKSGKQMNRALVTCVAMSAV